MRLSSQILNPVEWTPQFLHSPTGDQERGIVIRAVNYDNHREVEQLVELFALHYGGSYAYRNVYLTDFWQRHSGTDEDDTCSLMSMVAVDGDRFIAHLAVKSDPSSGCSEVLFAAVHPDFKKEIFRLGRLFWDFILEQAKRQNWKLIYHYNLVSNPLSQMVASRCFHAVEMALIPNLVPRMRGRLTAVQPRHERFSLIAMYHQVRPLPDEAVIYPPARHADMIKELYKPLKLKRRISSKQGAAAAPAARPVDAQDYNALRNSHQEQLGLFEINIEPSGIMNPEQALDYLGPLSKVVERENRRLCVRVALTDPGCPRFCSMLEEAGFRFCGILPIVDEHDRIVYARFDPSELRTLNLVTERARRLRDYVAGKH